MGTGGRNITNEQIFEIIENFNRGFQMIDFEFGNGKNIPQIIKSGNNYELKMFGKTWIINISEKTKDL